MNFASTRLRSVAWSCYAIGLLLLLAPLAELLGNLSAHEPGALPWRFGAAMLWAEALVLPVLGLGVCFASAVVLWHPRVLRVLSAVCAALLAAVLVALVLFVRVALQVRQVAEEAGRALDLAILATGATYLLEALALVMLVVGMYRTANRMSGRRPDRDGNPLVISTSDS